MKRYKTAIVGLGNIAWKFDARVRSADPLTHAGAYMKNPRTVLVGGCSPDKQDRRDFEKRYGAPAFAGIEEMIGKTEPHIVSICSPSALHYEHVEYSLRKRVPMIWLEKPPTLTVEDIDGLIYKVRAAGSSRLLVNYQRRYCRSYARLKELLARRALGRIVSVNLTYSRGLATNGSHILDMAFFLTGDKVDAVIGPVSPASGSANPSFMMKLAGGIPCSVSGMDLPYHCIDVSVTCERGRASIIHGGMKTVWEMKEEHELFPGFYRLRDAAKNLIGPGGFKGSMTAALGDIINAHEKRREPVSSLRTARRSQLVMEEVNKRIKAAG
ncbi:MAG: Gfo/Idh/MocA family oxidoreductase [Candidatus Omnitrophota bacterium]